VRGVFAVGELGDGLTAAERSVEVGCQAWLGRVVSVVLDVLGERFELGFLQQLAEGALAVPVWGEVLAVVFAQVLDLRGGVLVVDLSVLVAGTTVEAWVLWSLAHIPSFAAGEGL
jgi:hypothetical protein